MITERQIRSLWFNNMGGFGVSWGLNQVRLYKTVVENECTLVDSDDEEESTVPQV